jgi:nitroreductase
MNRRIFLRHSVAALAGAPCLSLLQGCDAYSRVNQEDGPEFGPLVGRIGSRLAEALRLAAMAPSGHNAQPWTVRIQSRDRWIIGSDRSRWLPAVDPLNREALLAVGAFVENLVVAGRNWGFEIEPRAVATSPFDTELLAVQLRPSPVHVGGIEAIRRRRTLRAGLETRELRSADVAHLSQGLTGVHYFGSGSREGRYLGQAAVEAMRAQVARDAAQAELARWIRWSDNEAQRHMNGLTPASMEIEGLAGWYVRHFYGADDVMDSSFRARSVDLVAQQARQCGGWIVITSQSQDVAGLIETGRTFERFFLRVRERRVGVHPKSQMLEEQPWQSAIAAELGLAQQPEFIIRVGYCDDYPPPVSLRMPLTAFVRA